MSDLWVAADLPCVHCGYNLRTQAASSRCPECGAAVRDTLTNDLVYGGIDLGRRFAPLAQQASWTAYSTAFCLAVLYGLEWVGSRHVDELVIGLFALFVAFLFLIHMLCVAQWACRRTATIGRSHVLCWGTFAAVLVWILAGVSIPYWAPTLSLSTGPSFFELLPLLFVVIPPLISVVAASRTITLFRRRRPASVLPRARVVLGFGLAFAGAFVLGYVAVIGGCVPRSRTFGSLGNYLIRCLEYGPLFAAMPTLLLTGWLMVGVHRALKSQAPYPSR